MARIKIWTVHLPVDDGRRRPQTALKATFVRERFDWLAFVFPPLRAIVDRSLLGLVAYVVAVVVLAALTELLGVTSFASGAVLILLHALFAAEAAWFQRLALDRRGFREVGVVAAPSLSEAEARFFAGWEQLDAAPGAPTRGAVPRSGERDVLGLFPTPGGLR